jgi:uracil-DNA glycosylase
MSTLLSEFRSVAPEWAERIVARCGEGSFIAVDQHLAADPRTILPPRADIFRAFALVPPGDVKVVIVGQDPYPTPGNANGLAFSVAPGMKVPASLRNIYKEVESDTGMAAPADGDLTFWARQGVLLLNAALTVAEGEANSHAHVGWEEITTAAIEETASNPAPIAYLLWGKFAAQKADVVGAFPSTDHHLILRAPHPSPLAKGFAGCRHFSHTNEFLVANGRTPIVWGRTP